MKFSLQQLMEGYWATQNKALIPFIAARLYRVPLTVRAIPSKPAHQRVVLYPTAGKSVTWDKPREEVERFVELTQSAAKQIQRKYIR